MEQQNENNVQFIEEESMESEKETWSKKKMTAVTNLFIKIGLAKDEKSANVVMVITAIIAFAITFFIIFRFIL